MYNRRDNALMQFKSYEQALNGKKIIYECEILSKNLQILISFYQFLAVSKMDKVKLFEKVISVGISKFPEIQIPIKNVS